MTAGDLESGAKGKIFDPTDADTVLGSHCIVYVETEDTENVESEIDAWIENNTVVVFGKSWCPFCKDVIEFLSQRLNVVTHVVNMDSINGGSKIATYVQEKTQHKTVPVVFINGKFRGGCEDVKSKQEQLEKELLMHRNTTHEEIKSLDAARLSLEYRSTARNPLFWFPNTVNNRVVRLTGFQVFVCSVLSAAFHTELWGRYLAVFLLVDFGLRMSVGSFLSPLGMIATVVASPFAPTFRPGAPKQFASFCGLTFSLLATIFYFAKFEYHEVVGAIWIAMIAGASGLEAFCDFCLGCVFFGLGIQFGLLPDDCYRIHTQTIRETQESYDYKMTNQNVPAPVAIDTNPSDPTALKYKVKTDEWTKNDFDPIKHMQVGYFAMPLSLAGLAVAFKMATVKGMQDLVVQEEYYYVISSLAAGIMAVFVGLYGLRLAMYPHKCWTEWVSPLHSNSFGAITITLLLFAFLVHDDLDAENNTTGRVLFWCGAIGQTFITVAKTGEWVGRRLETEHIHAHWMIVPVGLAVASLVASTIEPFATEENSNSKGNLMLARFFQSFGSLMWIALFAVTFFKTVIDHNSDNRVRHGVWIWLAAPCMIGLSQYNICIQENIVNSTCEGDFATYYFIGLFFLMGLCYAGLSEYAFFGQDTFNFGYWIECFALDALAACACLFYALNGWRISQNLQWLALCAAAVCNFCALCHTLVGIVNQRGVFTPEMKWGPLSFMKLTHEAFRGNIETLKHYLQSSNLVTEEGRHCVDMFAVHFQRFRILHEEHAKHEDEIIFKTFNDFFPQHAKKWNDDHSEDHAHLDRWVSLANKLLDTSLTLAERESALTQLQQQITPWFGHFEGHLRGEEDHLNPVGRKYLPLAVMKEMSRKTWEITPADRWEVIIPFIVNNLPRHEQRVRYLKVLTWSLQERAQQIGAILYRHTDAVMWERLTREVPEIIPRGVPGWRRYY
ncbi:hypothetical protein FisN_2Lh445 [Fistulifera solaris]|uniref:Uncharacterized protein n=1 Tax=Fistulifera solaris TaxID=1519565 RepID=A0A1Z5JPM1_FISSO|nr:hypothetical protein FisN_2Lh445 [Fistulifera solaris]|eukprot:GAX15836.1 hypothetical protein FisN_2Lh445 [Fistulifera solaris]